MAVIEEEFVLYDPTQAGGELGTVLMRHSLNRHGAGVTDFEFWTLDGAALEPGRYALQFVRRAMAPSGPPRQIEAPAFDGITYSQGRAANERPRLRIVSSNTNQPEGRQ